MSLRTKKILVAIVLLTVLVLANTWTFAYWLDHLGVIALAHRVRSEYITGTAIVVILVLFFLLGDSGEAAQRHRPIRRCPVCDHRLTQPGKYCGACGSRVQKQ